MRWWIPLLVGVVAVTACSDDTDATPAPEVESSEPAEEDSALTPDQPATTTDGAAPAPEDTSTAEPDSGTDRELLGYRASLYPTDFPTEKTHGIAVECWICVSAVRWRTRRSSSVGCR